MTDNTERSLLEITVPFPDSFICQADEPSIRVTHLSPPLARDTISSLSVPSLNKLCISCINRGLTLASSQSSPQFLTAAPPSPNLPATPVTTDNAEVPSTLDVLWFL
ncbi:hypothetical protein TNCT_318941 [Trichonephila clavata]|uniref:Uncharacterized protein n=1 Tax=Trichonephila clavata TaxID=2740835 RepID=A0A8X6HT28_TRICU|nr:hypothetical protein TNCT_318941 [Trichonephila clavata]